MTSQEDQLSSRDYQREAEATRKRLASSLDELNDRLTPGQVFDEFLTYAKGGGGTFFRALSNASRASPIPTLLIGAGCMMFLSEKLGLIRSVAPGNGEPRETLGGAPRTVSEGRWQGTEAVSRAANRGASSARGVADAIRDQGQNAASFVGAQASNVAGVAKAGAAAVGDTLSGAAESVREGASDLRDKVAASADH